MTTFTATEADTLMNIAEYCLAAQPGDIVRVRTQAQYEAAQRLIAQRKLVFRLELMAEDLDTPGDFWEHLANEAREIADEDAAESVEETNR